MKRKKSPVFNSLKCSIRRSQNFQKFHPRNILNVSNIDAVSENEKIHPLSTSSLSTQGSTLSTQDSQSFKARLERKVLSPPSTSVTTGFVNGRKKDLEISFETCSPSCVDNGPFFGLPSRVQKLIFHYKKIKGLYDWQERCLKIGLSQQNLLISLPTSSGKTLVAEVLMLRKILLYEKDSLFILPYISLVQEKVRALSSLAVDLNFLVDEYAASKGFYPPKVRRKRNTIYIATIEKANSLIESLLETGRMSELGIVVVDEVHMLADSGGRGARLEGLITKIKHFAGNIQLVSMSATVGNLEELAEFLNATLFKGGFRPVPLTQYLKVENSISVVNTEARIEEELVEEGSVKTIKPKNRNLLKLDPDLLTQLVEETIPEHSCLVFCPSRNNTQAVAVMLAACLPRDLVQWRQAAKTSLVAALKEEGSGVLCPILAKTVPFGIGYHHSGLTDGEKKLLEEAFIMGTLCCIVCTSTLAAGINLPARRVIIRAPYVGMSFLGRAQYHQMIGRAGRAGLDSIGESFLLATPKDLPKVKDLLLSPIETCVSRLLEDDSKGLTDLVFSMIGLQRVNSTSSALQLVLDSLLGLQAQVLNVDLKAEVEKVLADLCSQGLVRCQEEETALKRSPRLKKMSKADGDQRYLICRVGKAAVKGSVELRWANRLYLDLMNSRSHLAVNSHLHLLYMVTPYNISDIFVCKPETFHHIYSRLSEEDQAIAIHLGITNARAIKISMGMHPKQLDEQVLQRFYVALLLHRLLGGESIWSVGDTFQIHRGMIQQFLSSAVSFANSVMYFCQELKELWAYSDLLSSFTKTLSVCSCTEVTPLMALPAVKFGRAKLLYRAGFKSLTDIAKSTPQQMVRGVEHLSFSVARQIISSAKMLLLEKANTLQEEAEDLLLCLTS